MYSHSSGHMILQKLFNLTGPQYTYALNDIKYAMR